MRPDVASRRSSPASLKIENIPCSLFSTRTFRRINLHDESIAEDVDTDLEELQYHYYSSLRAFSDIIQRGRPANRHCTLKELFAQEWDFQRGREGLKRFLSLPPTWPLARLMFRIRNLKKQMETLLESPVSRRLSPVVKSSSV